MVIVVISIYFGIVAHSWIVFFIVFLISFSVLVLSLKAGYKIGRKNMNLWLSSLINCDHQYAWDGTGIAIE